MRNDKVEGDKVTFEIALLQGRVIYFNLAATGDHIEGEVKAPSNQREGDRSAHLSLKRVNSKEQ